MSAEILTPPRRARFALPQGERAWRAFAIQAVVLSAIISAFLAWVAGNVITNITRLNINTGFSFLSRPAGFEIAQKLIGLRRRRDLLRCVRDRAASTRSC